MLSELQGFPKKTPVFQKSKIFPIYSVIIKKVDNVKYQFLTF